jgi:hypothetical protein
MHAYMHTCVECIYMNTTIIILIISETHKQTNKQKKIKGTCSQVYTRARANGALSHTHIYTHAHTHTDTDTQTHTHTHTHLCTHTNLFSGITYMNVCPHTLTHKDSSFSRVSL